MNTCVKALTGEPWMCPPRFEVELISPVVASEWTWRQLGPEHSAIQANFLRHNDAEKAIDLISERYGDPLGYCVLGGNIACVSGWQDLDFDRQYRAVTTGAGAFPCGGMYYLHVTGCDAARTLELLTPRSISRLEIGQAAFTLFTTPEGTVDTEAIVLRDGPHSYQLSIGGDTRPPSWLFEALNHQLEVTVEDANLTSFNIKGPRRNTAMARLVAPECVPAITRLPTFRGIPVRTRLGAHVWVLRTIVGIEMWGPPEVIHDVWHDILLDSDHVMPCGWDVLASFRLECAQIQFFLCPLDIHRSTYLHDVGLAHVISRSKHSPFVGQLALQQPERRGGALWMAGLVPTTVDASRLAVGEVLHTLGGARAGYVTTAGRSPAVGRELCFAHLSRHVVQGSLIRSEDATAWRVVPLPILPNLNDHS